MTLGKRLALRFALFLPIFAALLFVPAGSPRFWQGWLFLVIVAAGSLLPMCYFLRHDPRLLERRMKSKEKTGAGRLFQRVWIPIWIAGLILPGLDYRFGWSREFLAPMPLWLTIVSQGIVLGGYVLIFAVMRSNTFAAATIQVEEGQKVISDGPYRIVRHPMYSGILMMALFSAPALGSWIALPVNALVIPVLVFRLVNEEKMLRQELPGYAEYCRRTRFRLLPGVY